MNTATIYSAFRAQLLANSAISDIVGDRAFFGVVPKDQEVPAIVLNPTGGNSDVFYRGSNGLAQLDIQVSIFSPTVSHLFVVYDAVNQEFNGFSGTLNEDTNALVAPCAVTAMLALPEDNGVHGAVFDVEITYDGV